MHSILIPTVSAPPIEWFVYKKRAQFKFYKTHNEKYYLLLYFLTRYMPYIYINMHSCEWYKYIKV